MIYIFLFFFLLLASFAPRQYRRILFNVSFFILLMLAAFRSYDIGTDTKTYSNMFNWINSGEASYIEGGWRALNLAVGFLGMSYTGVLFVAELLCLMPVCYVIKKSVRNINFGLFIYYAMYLYLHSFNIIRQCVAMSICLLSYYFFMHKKMWKACLSFLLAFSFHSSALVFLAVFAIRFLSISLFRCLLLLSVSYVLGLLFVDRFIYIVAGSYAGYLQGTDFGFREKSVSNIILCAVVNLFFVIFVMLKKSCLRKEAYWEKCLLLGLCCMNMTQTLVLGTRLMFYFTQAQCVFYPNYITSKRYDKKFLLFLLCVYFFANYIKILVAQWGFLMPYRFIF